MSSAGAAARGRPDQRCARPGGPQDRAGSRVPKRAGATVKSRGRGRPKAGPAPRQNALKHGMRAQKPPVLPDEDGAELEAPEAALIAELAWAGALRPIAVAARRWPRSGACCALAARQADAKSVEPPLASARRCKPRRCAHPCRSRHSRRTNPSAAPHLHLILNRSCALAPPHARRRAARARCAPDTERTRPARSPEPRPDMCCPTAPCPVARRTRPHRPGYRTNPSAALHPQLDAIMYCSNDLHPAARCTSALRPGHRTNPVLRICGIAVAATAPRPAARCTRTRRPGRRTSPSLLGIGRSRSRARRGRPRHYRARTNPTGSVKVNIGDGDHVQRPAPPLEQASDEANGTVRALAGVRRCGGALPGLASRL
jgi:hypothetical protein